MSAGPYLNLWEAAEFCGFKDEDGTVKIGTLQAAVRSKKVTYTRPGKAPLFLPEWLTAWMDKYVVPAEENPWGLSDGALNNVMDARPARTRRAS